MNEEFFISIIGEVFDGYTEAAYEGRPVYIKHVNIRDQRYIHRYYEKYKNIALKRGLESEAEKLKTLELDGIWMPSDSKEIEDAEKEIEDLKLIASNIILPSQQKENKKKINDKYIELSFLLQKKQEIVGKTAEDYAQNRASEEVLRYFLFKDAGLTEQLFSEDEFSELDNEQLSFFIKEQSQTAERLADAALKKSVLRPFFSMYLPLCEDSFSFYGKPAIQLSAYQLKVLAFGHMFNNIFKNVEDIPDQYREDPELLLSFVASRYNSDSKKPKIDENADASMLFGATKEDIEALKGSANTVSLADEVKKAGGSLNMEQMMKLAGH